MAGLRCTEDQVDLAIDHALRCGALRDASTVTYTEVFEAAGMAEPQQLHRAGDGQVVTEFMETFHHRCIAAGLPPLDALVVNTTGERGGLPGAGYFRINGLSDPLAARTSAEEAVRATEFWRAEKDRCRAWGQEPAGRQP